jgi:hypothetical protein
MASLGAADIDYMHVYAQLFIDGSPHSFTLPRIRHKPV